MRLVDAARCPYCARVRIVLAEKRIEYEQVEVDLSNRPPWVYELNASGKVPVLDDGFVLPESEVIMAYLEERYPEPPLLPEGLEERARARLLVHRFDGSLGDDYYAFRRGEPNALTERLDSLEVGESLYSAIAYVPWVIRARDMLGAELPAAAASWLRELEQRPSVAAEVRVVRAL
ncbi:MAG: glutathione S-transferase family protein [Gaiellaceae bacterium]